MIKYRKILLLDLISVVLIGLEEDDSPMRANLLFEACKVMLNKATRSKSNLKSTKTLLLNFHFHCDDLENVLSQS